MRCNNLIKNPFIFYIKINKNLYLLFNFLHGRADVVDYTVLKALNSDKYCGDYIYILKEFGYLIEKDYLDNIIESLIYKYYQNILSETPYLVLVPTHDCNARCIYCFQWKLRKKEFKYEYISKKIVNKAFEAANYLFERYHPDFKGKPKLILFGGEPLISPEVKDTVEYIFEQAMENNFELYEIVTNGIYLPEFFDIFEKFNIKNIQVTIDGIREVHNRRRPSIVVKDPFSKIEQGIDLLLNSNLETVIYARTNVDKMNLKYLADLAEFYTKKGWIKNSRFIPYIATTNSFDLRLLSRITLSEAELLDTILDLVNKDDRLKIFNIDYFVGHRHLKELLLMGSFSRQLSYCGSTNSTFTLDLYGKIYTCIDSAGREEFIMGYFYPNLTLNYNIYRQWHKSVLEKEKCKKCPFAFICGGGCNFNSILSGYSVDFPLCHNIILIFKKIIKYYSNYLFKVISEKMEVLRLYE